VALAAVALLAIGAAACGDDDDELTPAEANAKVCQERADLQSTLQSLGDLDPTSTSKSDLEAKKDEVVQAVDDLAEAADDVSQTEADAVRQAVDDFEATLDGADDDTTLQQLGTQLATTGRAVVDSLEALFQTAGCP
jgi:hypothetical protein